MIQVLTPHSFNSLKVGLQSLKDNNERLATDRNPGPVRRNGFVPPREFYTPIVGGNGLITILMYYRSYQKEDEHEIKFLHHASNEVTSLGHFTAYGYSQIDQGCCPRAPRLLCGLTQDGNYAVMLGPLGYTHQRSPITETPTVAIFQISPPLQLFEKRFTKAPFMKCAPIGIALDRSSIVHGQYRVLILTYKMAIICLNLITLERSVLQLESLKPQPFLENCITLSSDGRLLTVFCCMQYESIFACLVIDVSTLEPLCWVDADRNLGWLRWIFPMFSACETK